MIFLLLLILPFAGMADGLTLKAGTNTVIVSETIERRAWSRTAVMAGEDNRPLDPSGKLAAYSDAAALGETAARVGEIGDSAAEAMRSAVGSLSAVTNQIPPGAQHIAVSLPVLGTPNLQARVIAEGRDGSNDWQTVEFNRALAVPPSRIVRYTYPGGSASVECTWEYPWNRTGTVHRCTFPRPAFTIGAVIRTRRIDTFGGPRGLSFGTALVMVDGVQAYTGAVTNDLTGEVLEFDNGALIKKNGERNEQEIQ